MYAIDFKLLGEYNYTVLSYTVIRLLCICALRTLYEILLYSPHNFRWKFQFENNRFYIRKTESLLHTIGNKLIIVGVCL